MRELIKVTKGNDVRYFTNLQRTSKYTDIPVNCIKLHLRNHPLEEKNGYVFEVIDGSEIKYKYINIE